MEIETQLSRTHCPTRRAALGAVLLALTVFVGSALAASLTKNGSFEKDSNGDGIPNKWTTGGPFTPADKRVCTQSAAGSCSFKITADGSEKSLGQTILVSGSPQDDYTLSLWAKGKNLDLSGGAMRVFLRFNHTPSGSNNLIIDVPAGTSGWTKYTVTGTSTADFDSVTVYMSTFATSGKAWFDQVKLKLLVP